MLPSAPSGVAVAPPAAARRSPRRWFYPALGAVVVAVVIVLLLASRSLSAVPPGPGTVPPPAAPPPSPAAPIRITLTAVVGVIDYANGSQSGWLGVSGEPLTIVAGVTGAPPFSFAGGSYQDWKLRLTNSANESQVLYNLYPTTPGVTWLGAPGETYIPFNPDQSKVVEAQFVLPYQNYTGPLTFFLGD